MVRFKLRILAVDLEGLMSHGMYGNVKNKVASHSFEEVMNNQKIDYDDD